MSVLEKAIYSNRPVKLSPPPYSGPAAWYGRDMRADTGWHYQTTPDDLRELRRAIEVSRETALTALTPETFPLPHFGPKLRRIRDELVSGRGFHLIRGLPTEDPSPTDRCAMERNARMYLGIGVHIGTPVSQNGKGHLLGHVCDMQYDVDDPNVRTYQTTARQNYHADSCDIVGLLCLRPARSGGLSSIVSSVTLYNEVLARRPDLAALLSTPMAIDRRGEVPDGAMPYFTVAVFNHFDGKVSTYYSRRYAESAQRFPDVPKLTAAHQDAFDLLDALVELDELHLDMELAPGDMQLLHNHTILHDRTAFVDWPDVAQRRHLLRLWLCPPDGRLLPPCYAERWGSIEIGRRGGIMVPGAHRYAPLVPE